MSAFGYFGSKHRLARRLSSILPPHNAWVELFCGSAAMTIAKEPAPIEIINDINGDIVNFFEQLRNNSTELIRLIEGTPYAEAEFQLSREVIAQPISNVERARRFFISAMMAMNGAFGKTPGGFSYTNTYSRGGVEARVSRWLNMPPHLETVANRLRTVRISKRDALEMLEEFRDYPATLLYLDPPYLADRKHGYDFEAADEEFHKKLLTAVQNVKCMVLISGYQNDLYENMLPARKGWLKQVIEASTKGNDGVSHKREEVIWMNRAYRNACLSGNVPVMFSKKEIKNRKVNPKRRSRGRPKKRKHRLAVRKAR